MLILIAILLFAIECWMRANSKSATAEAEGNISRSQILYFLSAGAFLLSWWLAKARFGIEIGTALWMAALASTGLAVALLSNISPKWKRAFSIFLFVLTLGELT